MPVTDLPLIVDDPVEGSTRAEKQSDTVTPPISQVGPIIRNHVVPDGPVAGAVPLEKDGEPVSEAERSAVARSSPIGKLVDEKARRPASGKIVVSAQDVTGSGLGTRPESLMLALGDIVVHAAANRPVPQSRRGANLNVSANLTGDEPHRLRERLRDEVGRPAAKIPGARTPPLRSQRRASPGRQGIAGSRDSYPTLSGQFNGTRYDFSRPGTTLGGQIAFYRVLGHIVTTNIRPLLDRVVSASIDLARNLDRRLTDTATLPVAEAGWWSRRGRRRYHYRCPSRYRRHYHYRYRRRRYSSGNIFGGVVRGLAFRWYRGLFGFPL